MDDKYVVSSDYAVKMNILHATDVLMKETPLDELSVTNICKVAEISRPTFYRYFNDKFEIAQWHFGFLAKHRLSETGRTLNWYDANLEMQMGLLELKSFYCNAFQAQGNTSVTSYGQNLRRQGLIDTITLYKKMALSEKIAFQIDFLCIGEPMMVTRWILDGMKKPPRYLSQLLDDIVPRELYTLLNAPCMKVK